MTVLLRGTEAAKGTDIMERAFKIGCMVIFFDSRREKHFALVTNWFNGGPEGQTYAEYKAKHDAQQATLPPEKRSPIYTPCCNLVYVSTDKSKKDPYGEQLERSSSCSHGRSQGMIPFVGSCWAWPDEEDEATALAAKAYEQAVAK